MGLTVMVPMSPSSVSVSKEEVGVPDILDLSPDPRDLEDLEALPADLLEPEDFREPGVSGDGCEDL